MAAQPANTDISVYRRVRSYRQGQRHESVAALIKRLRPLVMSIPAEEVQVQVLTRDSNTVDLSPYMGEASHSATRGFPIVVGLRDAVTLEAAQEGLSNVDFAFQVGSDFFIQNTATGLTGDLHAGAQAL